MPQTTIDARPRRHRLTKFAPHETHLIEARKEINEMNRQKARQARIKQNQQSISSAVQKEIKTKKGCYRQEYVIDGKKHVDGTPYTKKYGPYWFYYYYNGGTLHKKYVGKTLLHTIP